VAVHDESVGNIDGTGGQEGEGTEDKEIGVLMVTVARAIASKKKTKCKFAVKSRLRL
jgi:hypothetical protein